MCLNHPQTILPTPIQRTIVFEETGPWPKRLGTTVLGTRNLQHSVYNNPKLETTQMSINRKVDEYMCHEHTVERHSAMSGPLGTHKDASH